MFFGMMVRRSGLCAWRGVAALLLFGILASVVFGQGGVQDTFVAISPSETSRYHIDFARHFFASPEAEKASRTTLYAALKDLESLKGKVANSADNLGRALELNDLVRVQFHRHYDYLYMRYAVNTNDEISLAESSALDAEINTRTAFLLQELMQIDEHTLSTFVTGKPKLKEYVAGIADIRRYQPHRLSLKEEELLNATAPNNDWQYDLYAKLRARTPPTTVTGASDQKA